MNKDKTYVIRDSEGRICAWCVGMSNEELADFLRKNPLCYVSVEKEEDHVY